MKRFEVMLYTPRRRVVYVSAREFKVPAGNLYFFVNGKCVAAFAAGLWLYVREVGI